MHEPSIASIRINGGRLCLDFVNTAAWQGAEVVREFLVRPEDLTVWAGRELLIGDGDRIFVSEADLGAARQLRSAIRSLMNPQARGEAEKAAALGILDERLAIGIAGGRPSLAGDRLLWQARPVEQGRPVERGRGGSGPEHTISAAEARLLAPVAVSAVELAGSQGDLARVKVCPGDGCNWLFLDTSRGGTRRWCSMESCGNRAKARGHYDRAKHAVRREDGRRKPAR